MSGWSSDELSEIAATDELSLATMRPDGTLRNPVTMWAVRLGEDVFIRAVNGPTGKWFRHALERHAGHVEAGSVSKNVTLHEVDASLGPAVDEAYQAKYRRYGSKIVGSTLTPQAQAASFRLEPITSNS